MIRKVVTFGEIMLRLSPPGYERFLQAKEFHAIYGGGEANVAISLSQFGVNSEFVTRLPSHMIGDACLNEVRKWGVDTSHIARGGERLGIYFCEKGASQRASNVIYDRSNSSISTASQEDFDFNEVFRGADWFHFTGITPALSETTAEIVKQACIVAKKMGLTVSCDLNYRKKLWSKEKASLVMGSLMQYVDVLIANEEDASDVFGMKANDTSITAGQLDEAGYKDVCKQLQAKFGFQYVAITLRESISASINHWSALLYNSSDYFLSKKYTISVIDRVGGGDSFGAGLIYALLTHHDDRFAIEFAVAASCLKHTIEGDCNIVTVNEVENLLKGDGSGRVQR